MIGPRRRNPNRDQLPDVKNYTFDPAALAWAFAMSLPALVVLVTAHLLVWHYTR